MNIKIMENKTKNLYLDKLKEEYIDRIKKFCKIQISNVNYLKNEKDYIIKISNKYESISSVDFAKKISQIMTNGYSSIVFLKQEDEIQADFTICISDMNVSCDMQTLLLLEQIYRAFKINNNEVYHK